MSLWNRNWPINPTTVTAGPIQFVLDSVDTEVERDTGTPGDSKPLPIIALTDSGTEVDFATEAKQDTQITALNAVNASLDIIEAIDFATEAKQDTQITALNAANASLDAIEAVDFATSAKQDDILTQLNAMEADLENISSPVSTDGAAASGDGFLVGGKDGSANFRPFLMDANGRASIDINSSALPTGAATEAKQDTGNTSLATLAGAVSGTEMQVDVLTLPALPAGTNNIGDVDVLTLPSIPAGTNNIGDVDVLTLPVSYNSGNSDATTQRVVIASDQATLPVSGTLTTSAAAWKESYSLDFSSSSVTTAAYTQVAASTANNTTEVEVYSTTTEPFILATGAAASEADKYYIFPGGNYGRISLSIASGTRISIKSVNSTVSSGYILFNFYG